ncbi:MAG: hypothetical protein ACTSXF_04170, partial [Promethearchaeota archaeon]
MSESLQGLIRKRDLIKINMVLANFALFFYFIEYFAELFDIYGKYTNLIIFIIISASPAFLVFVFYPVLRAVIDKGKSESRHNSDNQTSKASIIFYPVVYTIFMILILITFMEL